MIARSIFGTRTARAPIAAIVAAGALVSAFSPSAALAKSKAPARAEILMLGDSQLSFGGGPAFLSFFNNFAERCDGLMLPADKRAAVTNMATGIIGVRATGLQNWLSTTAKGKRMVCVKDPTGLVNARVLGAARTGPRWVQIGESRNHDFCKRGTSPMAALLATRRFRPKLMILHFMGLSAYHWLKPGNAERDMKKVLATLPPKTGCIVMTTAPGYRADINRPRLKAQPKIEAAVKATGKRCAFVRGLTSKTVAAFQGKAKRFYRHPSGKVRDPYHPVPSAARDFVKTHRAALCRAVIKQLWPDEPIGAFATTTKPASIAN
ncbi:MAG: hypothetical protein AAFV26_07155 [Pseudomonadota bacterium]